MDKGVPLLLLGGGGYTLRNVPRCWTYETAVAIDQEIPNEIPPNEYDVFFYPENKLHTQVSNMQNHNSEDFLHELTGKIEDNLKRLVLYTGNEGVEEQYVCTDDRDFCEELQVNSEMQEELSENHRQETNQ